MGTPDPLDAYWSVPPEKLVRAIGSRASGMAAKEARSRLLAHGRNDVKLSQAPRLLRLFLEPFRNPLLLILIFAAGVSIMMGDWVDAMVVIIIVVASTLMSALQEYRASDAVAKLRRKTRIHSLVMRNGAPQRIASEEIVPGDIVLLSAGNLVPADGVVLEAKDLFVDQSLMSGETFPVEKRPGVSARHASLAERDNCVFMGTSVSSGTGKVLILHTAFDTEFGRIAQSLAAREPETEFEKGLRQFGNLLMWVMILMVMAVLSVNIVFDRAGADTFLFAIALAVGLSPELLPAILTVTLAKGSQKMASLGVIVKRLNAIENLGSMTMLCMDKTGTLTKGVIRLDAALDAGGEPSEGVKRWAYLNAAFQTGLANPLDESIVAAASGDLSSCRKLDEIPYDFQRRRLGIVVDDAACGEVVLITKGALQNVLEVCDRVEGSVGGAGERRLDDAVQSEILARFSAWSEQGFRVLGIARKTVAPKDRYDHEDEQGMVFCGFLLFFDPPESGVRSTLESLARLGIQLKIITGDNRAVARHVAEAAGMEVTETLTGAELAAMNEEALWNLAARCNLFAEVDPHQKERIVRALQKSGHVVGFLGDGINDAPALHAADVGISVDRAVDVAKEAADIVLLRHDLDLIRKGIREGRHTFANTLKYIFITSSANFGNMISMAAATLFLPFLPLLAKQVLLNNFLSDIPAIGLGSDNVDREWESKPTRWDMRLIRSFMISFGLISTVFDFLTFAALLYLVGESAELFRTGWFVESLLTELFILVIIRTYKPFYESRPSRFLMASMLFTAALTIALPYLPFAGVFDLVPLPPLVLSTVLSITLLYVIVSEATKRRFYRKFGFGLG